MLELDVTAGLVRFAPAFRFEPADNLRTVYMCNYTQQRFRRREQVLRIQPENPVPQSAVTNMARNRSLASLAQVRIEIPQIWPYDSDADEFVRQDRRERTGWRRDEWA
jgi:hypothetical protein